MITNRKGQSVVEILVALAVMAISMSSIIIVSFGNQSVIIDAQNSELALQMAKDNMEEARASAKANFSLLNSSSSPSGIFLKEMIIENLSQFEKRITTRVSWTTESLRPQKIELISLITDPVALLNQGGDSGGGGIAGDWQNPQTLGSVDLGPGSSSTGLDVLNKIVYISAEASAASKPDFFIIDASNGISPIIKSSLNTGPSLEAVDVAGSFAYVANRDTDAQLQIINISNINSPTLVSSFKLLDVSGIGAIGKTIFYSSPKVYIGTQRATGPEFHVVDVSNTASPVELGSFEVNADINSMYVSGNLAYISTSLDDGELKVLDVSNPGAITLVGTYNPDGNNDGKSLFVNSLTGYFGRLNNEDEFSILNLSDVNSISLAGSVDIGTDVNGLVTRENLVFIGTSDSNREFQVWNIQNPASPVLWSHFNFPQIVTGIDYEDNLVYAAVRSNDGLRIITSTQ